MIDLHRTDDDEVTDEELKAWVEAWSRARRNLDGAVGSTPANIELRVLGSSEGKSDLFVEGRNALRTDIASFLNLRASMLDGTSGTDSLTYTTREGERNLFYELDLPYWTDPIEARLSMNDVCAEGRRIRFDRSEQTTQPNPTGPTVED
jgi:phage portal protein BeeE